MFFLFCTLGPECRLGPGSEIISHTFSVRCPSANLDSLWHLACTSLNFELGRGSRGSFMAVACPVSVQMLQEGRGDESDKRLPWFALRVRSQRETAVANRLNAKGYQVFLPTSPFQKRWSDRIKKTNRPLFPGYLFCKFDPADRLPILKTPWLFQIVGLGQTPVPVDDEELDAVRNLVMSGSAAEPWPYVEMGQKVRIRSGTFPGVAGVLTGFRGNRKLIVSLTLLRRSVAVEIDSALVSVEPVAVSR